MMARTGFLQVNKEALSPENRELGEYLAKSRDELLKRVMAMDPDWQKGRLELATYAGVLAHFMGSAISRCTGGKKFEEVLTAYLNIIADHALDEFTKISATMPVLHEGTETKQ